MNHVRSRTLESRSANNSGFYSLLRQEKYQEKEHAKPSNHTAAPCAIGSGDGVRVSDREAGTEYVSVVRSSQSSVGVSGIWKDG